MSNVYEALVDLDPLLQLRPGLAESWYTSDETTWVFRLRNGVHLHDGRVLSAQDVATSLTHAGRDPGSRRRVQLAAVRDVTAEGQTVVIRTTGAFSALPLRLANVYIWSSGWGGQPEGTGPYRISSSTPSETVLEAFDGYRSQPPAIRRLNFRVVPEVDERVRQVSVGEAEFMIDVPAQRVDRLPKGVQFQAVKGLRVFLLGLSCEPGKENPFSDVRVRRAVSMSINRDQVVAPAGGYAQGVDRIVSPEELGGHHAGVLPQKYDPERARALLKEAGYTKGFDADLYLSIKYRHTEVLLDEAVRQLGTVGIRVHPHVLPVEEYVKRIEGHDMPLFLLGWVSDTGDGRVSYDYLIHTRSGLMGLDNGAGYSNPETDALIEAASRTNAPDVLGSLFARLEQQVAEDAPLIPLFRQDDLYAYPVDLLYTPRLDRRLRFETARWR
jgi:peptide/nickel transport system substrate-binding protein